MSVLEEVEERIRRLRERFQRWGALKIRDIFEFNKAYEEIVEILNLLSRVERNHSHLKQLAEALRLGTHQPPGHSSSPDVERVLRDAGAPEQDIERVRAASRVLGGRDLYYYIRGLARERHIPLTPRHVGELRRALGA